MLKEILKKTWEIINEFSMKDKSKDKTIHRITDQN